MEYRNLWLIIPLYNEESSIKPLKNDLLRAFEYVQNFKVRVILVDDGSIDETYSQILNLEQNESTTGISFSALTTGMNKGKLAAQVEGAKHVMSIGIGEEDLICFLDGDGQHSPLYIHELIGKMDYEQQKNATSYIYASRDQYKRSNTSKIGHFFLSCLQRALNLTVLSDISEFVILHKEPFLRLVNSERFGIMPLSSQIPFDLGRGSTIKVKISPRYDGTTTRWTPERLVAKGLLSLFISPWKTFTRIFILTMTLLFAGMIYAVVSGVIGIMSDSRSGIPTLLLIYLMIAFFQTLILLYIIGLVAIHFQKKTQTKDQ